MNKTQFIEAYAEKTGLSKSEAAGALKSFDEVVIQGLLEDGKVRIGDLGFMNVSYRGPRSGRNPKNPEEVYHKPESVAATFKASENLKNIIITPEIIAAVKARKFDK